MKISRINLQLFLSVPELDRKKIVRDKLRLYFSFFKYIFY